MVWTRFWSSACARLSGLQRTLSLQTGRALSCVRQHLSVLPLAWYKHYTSTSARSAIRPALYCSQIYVTDRSGTLGAVLRHSCGFSQRQRLYFANKRLQTFAHETHSRGMLSPALRTHSSRWNTSLTRPSVCSLTLASFSTRLVSPCVLQLRICLFL